MLSGLVVIVPRRVSCRPTRVPIDTTVTFDATASARDPEAWLARTEAAVPGIKTTSRRKSSGPIPATKAKTPIAIVYVHGFSASKGRRGRCPTSVAAALGANLFYTRLTGHGKDGAAMATASVNAWVNDYAEALAIGRAIGEKVIVIGVSTGAALAVGGDAAGRHRLPRTPPGWCSSRRTTACRPGRDPADHAVGRADRPTRRRRQERGFAPVNEVHAFLDNALSDRSAAADGGADEARPRGARREDEGAGACCSYSPTATRWSGPN